MKYEIHDNDEGEVKVLLGDFVILKLFYKAEHSKSPFDKEEANKLAEIFIGFLENSQPSSELSEDEYKGKLTEIFEEFEEMFENDGICAGFIGGVIKG